jgi:TetR/AcrR family transcriptional repressor of nem operon
MRYPAAHKEETRRRILTAASEAFRERGVDGTGVDLIMRRAGLTHGGFYAHFPDKSALVAQACTQVFEDAVVNLDRIAVLPTASKRARMLIDSYLSARHRDNRGSGCLVVAVAADMARLDGPGKAAFAKGFETHLERLGRALRLSEDPAENLDRMTHLMATLVGALLMARSVDDPIRSDALLSSSRRMLRRHYCTPL